MYRKEAFYLSEDKEKLGFIMLPSEILLHVMLMEQPLHIQWCAYLNSWCNLHNQTGDRCTVYSLHQCRLLKPQVTFKLSKHLEQKFALQGNYFGFVVHTSSFCWRAKQVTNDVWSTKHSLPCTISLRSKFIPNEFRSVEYMLPSWSWQEIKSNYFDAPYIL